VTEREFTCPACGQAGGDGYDHRLDGQFDRLIATDLYARARRIRRWTVLPLAIGWALLIAAMVMAPFRLATVLTVTTAALLAWAGGANLVLHVMDQRRR
jgi:hypothetical protein